MTDKNTTLNEIIFQLKTELNAEETFQEMDKSPSWDLDEELLTKYRPDTQKRGQALEQIRLRMEQLNMKDPEYKQLLDLLGNAAHENSCFITQHKARELYDKFEPPIRKTARKVILTGAALAAVSGCIYCWYQLLK